MFALTAVGAVLFFLPGLLALTAGTLGDPHDRERTTTLPTSTPEAIALVGFIAIVAHLFAIVIAYTGYWLLGLGGLQTRYDVIDLTPDTVSTEAAGVALLYALIASLVGIALGSLIRWRNERETAREGSLARLCQLDRDDDDLTLLVYAYDREPADGGGRATGLVGPVSGFLRNADGSLNWIEIVDPNPFSLKLDDGNARIVEYVPQRAASTETLTEALPTAHLDAADLGRVVFALYRSGGDTDTAEAVANASLQDEPT